MKTRFEFKGMATLHNKHHLVLTDARTGKVKQEAWAYNIILDKGFVQLIEKHFGNTLTTSAGFDFSSSLFGDNVDRGWGGQTFLGTGTGEVLPSTPAMFSFLTRKPNVHHAIGTINPASSFYRTQKAVWDETELQNTAITEVALGVANNTGISTLALIEDSEGNPITVNKGEFDILTVYSTVYLEMSHNYGQNFSFVDSAEPPIGSTPYVHNFFKYWIQVSAVAWSPQRSNSPLHKLFAFCAGRSSDPVTPTDPPVKQFIGTDGADAEVGGQNTDTEQTHWTAFSAASKSITMRVRFAANRNNHADGIREIGFCMRRGGTVTNSYTQPVFRSVLPIPGVWESWPIEADEIGTGDGEQLAFAVKWKPIKPGTVKIYLDTVEQTTGVSVNEATGAVTFDSAPAQGVAVTADYEIEFIPKDENHVLDVSLTLQFADGNAA